MAGIKGMFGGLPSLAMRQWRRFSGSDQTVSGVSSDAGLPSAEAIAEDTVTQVVFLPRAPQWGYCFWTISARHREQGRRRRALSLWLRLRDVAAYGPGGPGRRGRGGFGPGPACSDCGAAGADWR